MPLAILPPSLSETHASLQFFANPSIRQVQKDLSVFSFEASGSADATERTQLIFWTDMTFYEKPSLSAWNIRIVNPVQNNYEPVKRSESSLFKALRDNLNNLLNLFFKW